jgi:hypothetical protein
MGGFTRKISKRIGHVRLKVGYCLICGEHGKLSQDHVPPKCCITIRPTEQRLITEMMGVDASTFKGVPTRNGSSFRTICQKCNSALGLCDEVVGKAYKELTRQIVEYFRPLDKLYHFASTSIDAITYARSMIGHMLAATTDTECLYPPASTDFFDPLQSFVLGDDTALSNTHDIYYWFYPRNMHLSAKLVGVHNKGHQALVGILSFFPVAFMVTKKNEGIYPAQAIKLELTDKKMTINLTSANLTFADFPFVPLTGDQYYMLDDDRAIISYPVGR